ncbi:MAG: SPOR domain-containing protein [Treponema sp.]|nr:SPOR domain-containing protein [Treponema sp.]
MKKLIGFVLTLFTVATLFAAARPSLDGRALVADAGSMPKGLFARTIGYLPGDSVAVTNPATGSTVDVLILGAIDPSEGVAILLSPEAADKLSITRDSNVQVKITKRAGSLDEVASGAAVVSEGDGSYESYDDGSDASENPIEEIDGDAYSSENAVTMKSLLDEPVVAPVTPVVVTVPEVPAEEPETVAEPEEIAEVENTVEEPVIVVETPHEEEVIEPVSETYAMETPAEEDEAELFDPFAVAEGEKPEVDRIVFIDAPGDPAGDEPAKPAEETPVSEDAYLDELAEMIKPVDEEEPVVAEDVIVEYVDDVPPETQELAQSEKVEVEDVPEVEEETDTEETSEALAEAPAEEEAADGVYQPIVLVPAGENPPVAEETPTVVVEPVAVVAQEEKPAVVEEQETVTKAPSTEDFLVPSLKDLQRGKYYVQIASLGATENVEGLLAKYSEKYPMVVVPLSSGKNYQVMVGPLTTDEYTVVQEKFRAFGFKDAFLRKIR